MLFTGNTEDKCKKGIYKICCTSCDRFYIGAVYSDKGLWEKYLHHKNLLIKNTHYNKKLQKICNKHGIDRFHFVILMTLRDNEKVTKKQHSIIVDTVTSVNCINSVKDETGDKLTREYWVLRNYVHSNTIARVPKHITAQQIKNHCTSYKQNRKNHSNYKPIKVSIKIPGRLKTTSQYETEQDFLLKTKFDYSTLAKLKKNKIYTVIKRLPATKHSYKVGTVFTLII